MSLEELLLHALIMEREAVQRYKQLARMMECVGNTKVAKIFTKMSRIEAKHVAKIEDQIGEHALPILTPSEFRWRGTESPENADSSRVYQLMTPTQAMRLALDCEKHAFDFFDDVVEVEVLDRPGARPGSVPRAPGAAVPGLTPARASRRRA